MTAQEAIARAIAPVVRERAIEVSTNPITSNALLIDEHGCTFCAIWCDTPEQAAHVAKLCRGEA